MAMQRVAPVFVVTGLLTVVSMGCASAGEVRRENDPYTRRSSVVLENMEVDAGAGGTLFWTWRSSHEAKLAVVQLARKEDGASRYHECRSLSLLVDGKPETPVNAPSQRVDAQTSLEIVEVAWTRESVRAMAAAHAIRGRLCRDEFSLDSERIRLIRTFAATAWP